MNTGVPVAKGLMNITDIKGSHNGAIKQEESKFWDQAAENDLFNVRQTKE
eukprot:CAMPEP_0168611836 /NCGR_PEP_ID=MMETSP0449_2-20121227/2578_1 /TAXON_ID=1082188 /ORGANISM="Strombidium rassoulzadegani, Strain ras09" /LENGTH=49 /DNA_ID=CAMNT_0008652325 /DNA_START=200 /DNA_END=349 /DNA_ORIENTATION=-